MRYRDIFMLDSIICDVVFIGCIELYGPPCLFIALYLDIDVELYRTLSCITSCLYCLLLG